MWNALFTHYCFKLCKRNSVQKRKLHLLKPYLKQGQTLEEWRKERRKYPFDRGDELEFLEKNISRCQRVDFKSEDENEFCTSVHLSSQNEVEFFQEDMSINAVKKRAYCLPQRLPSSSFKLNLALQSA